jgi:MoxR-like ATPase
VGYPTLEEEQEILRRRTARKQDAFSLEQVTQAEELLAMRSQLEEVFVDPDMERYIAELVHETRQDTRTLVGASPRGSLALLKMARAQAALEGRSFVLPDDIKDFLEPALVHRLILKPDYWMKKSTANEVLKSVASLVAVPVIENV